MLVAQRGLPHSGRAQGHPEVSHSPVSRSTREPSRSLFLLLNMCPAVVRWVTFVCLGLHMPGLENAGMASHLTAFSLFYFSLCPHSTVSKQRKNVISCVTVHDSPYSDSSSNTSPYSVQQRAGHNNTNAFDSKGALENHCTGNPRTIIVPPLKTQASEVLVECNSLGPGNLGPGQARNSSLEVALLVHC